MPENRQKVKPRKVRAFEAIAASTVNPTARLVAFAILWRVRPDSLAWIMPTEQIIADTRLSRSAVFKALAQLRQAGLIEIVKRYDAQGNRGWSVYKITADRVSEMASLSPRGGQDTKPLSDSQGLCSAREEPTQESVSGTPGAGARNRKFLHREGISKSHDLRG